MAAIAVTTWSALAFTATGSGRRSTSSSATRRSGAHVRQRLRIGRGAAADDVQRRRTTGVTTRAEGGTDGDDLTSEGGDGGAAGADDWIANWKAGNFPRAKGWKFGDPSDAGVGSFSEAVAPSISPTPTDGQVADDDGEEDEDEDRSNKYGGDPAAFAYIFCHNLLGPPQDSFASMYLRDTLGAVGIELILPDLRRTSGVESGDSGNFTVTSAVAALEAAVESIPAEKRPVRIIGSSLGAYVAAVYASKPENQGAVDRVMLLAPPFKLDALLAEGRLEKSLGVTLSDEFKADAALHPPFPFLTCRAYVVHGYDDEAAPLANSLTWVRDASVNMRAGATANEGEVAAERRLLEVGGMGHSIEDGLPQIKAKLIDFFKLPFVLPEGFE